MRRRSRDPSLPTRRQGGRPETQYPTGHRGSQQFSVDICTVPTRVTPIPDGDYSWFARAASVLRHASGAERARARLLRVDR